MMRNVVLVLLFICTVMSYRTFAEKDTAGGIDPTSFISESAVNKSNKQLSEHESDSVSHRIAVASDDYMRAAIDKYMRDKYMKSPEFMACMVILFFAALVCIAEVIMFLFGKINSSQIIKLLIITLIIFAVLFLIASGYSTEQISPAFGLLGTIAGYLLGKSSNETEAEAALSLRKANKQPPTHE